MLQPRRLRRGCNLLLTIALCGRQGTEKASLHTAATAALQPQRAGAAGKCIQRGCSSWRLPRVSDAAASLIALSQSPRHEMVRSPELFRFCNQTSGTKEPKPLRDPSQQFSPAKRPPSPQQQKTPSTGMLAPGALKA